MNIPKKIKLILSILLSIITIVFLILSTDKTSEAFEVLFKISISLSLSFSLALNFSIKHTSINNSYNTIYVHSENSSIDKGLEFCYLINRSINVMLELFEKKQVGESIEDKINRYLKDIINYSEEVEKDTSMFLCDSSINDEDKEKIRFMNEYIRMVSSLKSYIPFKMISIKSIQQKNQTMKTILMTIAEKYQQFINNLKK